MRGRISVRFSRLPVERLSTPRTWSPCASTARASADPMKPATPVMRYVAIGFHHSGCLRGVELRGRTKVTRMIAFPRQAWLDNHNHENARARLSRNKIRADRLIHGKAATLIAAEADR